MQLRTLLSCLASVGSVAQAAPHSLSSRDNAPVVKVYNGSYSGAVQSALGSEVFLGIPYAQAPTGDLRLRVPQSLNTSWSDVRDASKWGNSCPGVGISSTPNASYNQFYTLDEDCLNINVIRPAGSQAGDNLPVLFWIFGGGFTQGTAQDPRYNGSYIVQRSVELGQPIIFASINYRLNAFGFPSGQAAAKEGVLNLGLRDQRLALHWVQENIYYFGGDPAAVTIWGQSAGGSSTVYHVTAYGGRDDGLFRSSQTDSGVFLNGRATVASTTPGWNTFVNATGCAGSSDTLACLRAVPYQQYYNASVAVGFNPSPVPDGDFIQASIPELLQQGKFVERCAVMGSNLDEGTSGIGAPTGINTNAQFDAVARRIWGPLGASNATLAQFDSFWPDEPALGSPHNTGDGTVASGFQDKRVFSLYTDAVTAGTRLFARVHQNVAPTFSYRFWQVPDNSSIELGSYHLAEVPYFMGVLDRTPRNPLGYRADTLALSRMMQQYLINYVNTGNPNQGTPADIYWPDYSEGQQPLIFLRNVTATMDESFQGDQTRFLDDVFFSTLNASSAGGPSSTSHAAVPTSTAATPND